MDKLIHEHLDSRLDIQDKAINVLDKAIDGINLNALLRNPEAELARVASQAMEIVQDVSDDAAKEGLNFAVEVKKRDAQDKAIIFQNSNDPKLNQDDPIGDKD